MKKLSRYIALPAFVALLFNACKNENTQCPEMLYTGTPPYTYFELVDSQGRDLLNSATPGYFDTTFIRTANQKTIRIIPPTTSAMYPGTKNHARFAVWDIGTGTFSLKLSPTVTDQITTKFTQTDACSVATLTSITYNGVVKQPTSKDYFLIVK